MSWLKDISKYFGIFAILSSVVVSNAQAEIEIQTNLPVGIVGSLTNDMVRPEGFFVKVKESSDLMPPLTVKLEILDSNWSWQQTYTAPLKTEGWYTLSVPKEGLQYFPVKDSKFVLKLKLLSGRKIIGTRSFEVIRDSVPPAVEIITANQDTGIITLTAEDKNSGLTDLTPITVVNLDSRLMKEIQIENSISCTPYGLLGKLLCSIEPLVSIGERATTFVKVRDKAGNTELVPLIPRESKEALNDEINSFYETILTKLARGAEIESDGSGQSMAMTAGLLTPMIPLDLYMFHLDGSSYAPVIASGWSAASKVDYLTSAAEFAASSFEGWFSSTFGSTPDIYVRSRSIFYHKYQGSIPQQIQNLDPSITRIEVADSFFPSMFSNEDCENEWNMCITEQDPCEWIGYNPTTGAGCVQNQWEVWIARGNVNELPSFFTQPSQKSNNIPVIMYDSLLGLTPTGGNANLKHGTISISYTAAYSTITPTNLVADIKENQIKRIFLHEMGHIFGLGHADFEDVPDSRDNIMRPHPQSNAPNLTPVQLARVRATLETVEFRPSDIGKLIPEGTHVFDGNNGPNNDCVGDGMSLGDLHGRLLDFYQGHTEECETEYSGVPSSPGELITRSLSKKYCPVIDDGNGVMLPTPIAVNENNAASIRASYPNVKIRECEKNTCRCVPVPPKDDDGYGGSGEVDTGGGNGDGGGEDDDDDDGPGTGHNTCNGIQLGLHPHTGPDGPSHVVGQCPKDAVCPKAKVNGVWVERTCKSAMDDGCAHSVILDWNGHYYCCACQPEPVMSEVPREITPREGGASGEVSLMMN